MSGEGNINEDLETCRRLFSQQLEIFEGSELYDCVIRVRSTSSSDHKDFKCHKLILSKASAVFMAMFSGDFKEAKMGRDEPILLDKVDPQVFECAMRFVYGREKDFKSVDFGLMVFKFADEMQIDDLTQELDKFLKASMKKPGLDVNIFPIFDLYHLLEYKQGFKWCMKIMEMLPKGALDCHGWRNLSPESVEKFLMEDCLGFPEYDVLKALVRWGQGQVQKDGGDPKDSDKLRSKILSKLKLIRFYDLSQNEFAMLCQKELGGVLSADEKCSVFMALATGNRNLLPTSLMAPSMALSRKKRRLVVVRHLPYLIRQNGPSDPFEGPLVVGFAIQSVRKDSTLTGLNVDIKHKLSNSFTFELQEASGFCIGKGNSGEKDSPMRQHCEITPQSTLAADKEYLLVFYFHRPGGWRSQLNSCNAIGERIITSEDEERSRVTLRWSTRLDDIVGNIVFLLR